MTDFRYILKPYSGPSSRTKCPSCGKQRKFSNYIDTTTGNEIADNVGRCDRENSCGYHLTPKQYFENGGVVETGVVFSIVNRSRQVREINSPVQFLPFDILEKSVKACEKSDLYPFLKGLFRENVAKSICDEYFVGSTSDGYTAFWQVDINGNVRQVKVIKYLQNGHRDRDFGARFAGKKILDNQNANLRQCFFGEYLLSMPENANKKVAIVESEKTAMISSVYFPDLVWLATGGSNGCKWTDNSVCSVLKDRKVLMFPDIGKYDSWRKRSLLLAATAGCHVSVSNLLESNPTEYEKKEGLDLADYLLHKKDSSGLALTGEDGYPIIWDLCRNGYRVDTPINLKLNRPLNHRM